MKLGQYITKMSLRIGRSFFYKGLETATMPWENSTPFQRKISVMKVGGKGRGGHPALPGNYQ